MKSNKLVRLNGLDESEEDSLFSVEVEPKLENDSVKLLDEDSGDTG
jgi:hypothetical protein